MLLLGLQVSGNGLRRKEGDNLLRAVIAYEKGAGDFADYLVREQAKSAGYISVATFDGKLLIEHMFTSP